MPGRDGTGPAGYGMGRGIGWRANGWVGCRRVDGYGSYGNYGGYYANRIGRSEEEWLTNEKEILETRLKSISRQLESLSKTEK